MIDALAVFDIGKTNIKLSLVDSQGRELQVRRRANVVVTAGLYPHHDVDAIETWLLSTLRELAQQAHISAIVPITHGATAALVDDAGLVLPVLDYEHSLPSCIDRPQYDTVRAPFAQTCSPALGQGLNLGRQLYWQQQTYPDAFHRARRLLLYPQYWAWRLCGVAAAEVTSLGCHSDLWQAAAGDYSRLVSRCDWQHLMPPLRHAWDELGTILPQLARETGLPPQCKVLCGVHDSNASLLRYLEAEGPRTILSTGTWVIAAALDGSLEHLQEASDMLANTNVLGQPVACMRFMGGREFAELAGTQANACSLSDLQGLIDRHSMALPCFSGCGGPFAARQGRLLGPAPSNPAEQYALATLYCVLMTDFCLEQLNAQGTLVVDGSFTANPYFSALLAIADGRTVYCSQDSSGTTVGGWLLWHWRDTARVKSLAPLRQIVPPLLTGWEGYRRAWRDALKPVMENDRQDQFSALQ